MDFSFKNCAGILQGNPTSSKIFAIAMERIACLVKDQIPSFASLDYLDDLNVFAKSPAEAQVFVDHLSVVLENVGLHVNVLKSKVI